jgi:hypothetical protein
MRHSFRFCSLTLIIAALSIQLLAQAAKSTTPDPDELVIHEFILTMAKVQKFSDVAKKMNEIGNSDPVMVAEMKKISDSDTSNVNKAALLEKSPHLSAFLKTNGITAKEFIFTPMTVLTAALATAAQDLKAQPPDFVNPANIQFVRDHKVELEKYNLLGGEKEPEGTQDKDKDQDDKQ